MTDTDKTRAELLADIEALQQRITQLEQGLAQARHADRALLESEEKSRNIIDHSPDGIVLTDEAGLITEWSPGMAEITQLPAAEAVGRALWDVRYELCPDELKDAAMRDLLCDEIARVLQAGSPGSNGYEYEIQLVDGVRRHVHQSTFAIQTEVGYRFGAIVRDTSEVRNALRALQESEGRYRTLFEQSPIPLWEEDFSQAKAYLDQLRAAGVTDFAHYFTQNPGEIEHCSSLICITDVNQATMDLCRVQHKVDAYRMLHRLPFPEEIDLLRDQLIAIAEGRTAFAGDGWGRNMVGEPVSISLRWVVVAGYECTLSKVIVSMLDTTRQRLADTERERLILELNAFAHTVAHDLKNPLGGITGFASLIANNLAVLTPEEICHYLGLIERDGHKMFSIIDELLVLSTVRSLDHVELVPLDMLYVIAGAMSRVGFMMEEYHAEIVLPSEELPVACGYASWVEEVWANYLSNAIKYGGHPPRIEVGGEDLGNGMARFWVKDNGAGLGLEKRTQLFEPFTRLEQAQTEGHGLGLSIVRRIVERLGGTVGVTSEPGSGSQFYFTLPLAKSKLGSQGSGLIHSEGE